MRQRRRGGATFRSFNTSYDLIGVCPLAGCVIRLGYEYLGNGYYRSTYNSSEHQSDVHVVYNFPQGIVSGLDESFTISGSTMQTRMTLHQGKYAFDVNLRVGCRGTGQKKVYLWTDFKVKGDLKKYRKTM